MWQIYLNFYQRMVILPLKKRVNWDKCSFTTKQRMFGVFAIDEILLYRWTRFVGSRTLCHPDSGYYDFKNRVQVPIITVMTPRARTVLKTNTELESAETWWSSLTWWCWLLPEAPLLVEGTVITVLKYSRVQYSCNHSAQEKWLWHTLTRT